MKGGQDHWTIFICLYGTKAYTVWEPIVQGKRDIPAYIAHENTLEKKDKKVNKTKMIVTQYCLLSAVLELLPE